MIAFTQWPARRQSSGSSAAMQVSPGSLFRHQLVQWLHQLPQWLRQLPQWQRQPLAEKGKQRSRTQSQVPHPKRACVAPDMNWVQQADDPEMTPAPTCVEDVAKRVKQQAGKTTASVVAKRENKWRDQASKCH